MDIPLRISLSHRDSRHLRLSPEFIHEPMPGILTMNGHYQLAASAPLDLRTNNRERGSAGGSLTTPDSNCHAGNSDNPAELRGDPSGPGNDAENGRTSLTAGCPTSSHTPQNAVVPGTEHDSMFRSPLASPKLIPGSETDVVDKHTTNKRCSTLPFRKRQFPIGTEQTSPAPADGAEPASVPENTDSTRQPISKVIKRETHVHGTCVVPATHRHLPQEVTPNRDGYPIALLPTYTRYYAHPGYPVLPWPMVTVPPLCAPPPAYQSEHLQANVRMATHQDEDGDTPLHIAVVHGDECMVRRLIHPLVLARKDLDMYNILRQTPLHLAVITKQPSMVEALLRGGGDPGALDRNGQTALHLCCEYGQQECLSVILSFSSADHCLEVRNYEGLSPLHLAVQGSHTDLAKMLLEAGADINATDDKSGQCPLMHAVETNNTHMVHFLIENNCDVNCQSYSGNTALHIACGRGLVDIVRLLLKNRADSSLKNYHNDTPVMVAKNKKVTDVLRGRGSKQARGQDLHWVSAPHHRTNTGPKMFVSPNHSQGGSPSATPRLPTRGPTPALPTHSQRSESPSDRHSPMDTRDREVQLVGTAEDKRTSRSERAGPVYYPLQLHSPRPDGLHPHHLHPSMAQGVHYSEIPYNMIPHLATVPPTYQMSLSDSRPASGCSEHSDVSSISLSSGDKWDH